MMNVVTFSDRRRAAALLAQYACGDVTGTAAVLTEAATSADGLGGLLAGLVEVVFLMAPPLREPEGVELLRRIAAGYAKFEEDDADV